MSPIGTLNPGQSLRSIREQLGLSIREVERASAEIAARRGSQDFLLGSGQLASIEMEGAMPSIHKLYSLAAAYHHPLEQILALYGIEISNLSSDMSAVRVPRTHLRRGSILGDVEIPERLEASFDPTKTTDLQRFIAKWGSVPLEHLTNLMKPGYRYGYIGTEDRTMYPLIVPGSFVQIDEQRNWVVPGPWQWEIERPIYFVETRAGFTCCWCALRGGDIVLQPHPLSAEPVQILRLEQDAEVLGQVVAVAMRLDTFDQNAISELETKPLPSGSDAQK
jgi:transcriptional regulator with XRE-family HTH domain